MHLKLGDISSAGDLKHPPAASVLNILRGKKGFCLDFGHICKKKIRKYVFFMRIFKAKKYYEQFIMRSITFDCQGTSDINHAPAVRTEFAYVMLAMAY